MSVCSGSGGGCSSAVGGCWRCSSGGRSRLFRLSREEPSGAKAFRSASTENAGLWSTKTSTCVFNLLPCPRVSAARALSAPAIRQRHRNLASAVDSRSRCAVHTAPHCTALLRRHACASTFTVGLLSASRRRLGSVGCRLGERRRRRRGPPRPHVLRQRRGGAPAARRPPLGGVAGGLNGSAGGPGCAPGCRRAAAAGCIAGCRDPTPLLGRQR